MHCCSRFFFQVQWSCVFKLNKIGSMCIKYKQQSFMLELKEREQVGGNFMYQEKKKKTKPAKQSLASLYKIPLQKRKPRKWVVFLQSSGKSQRLLNFSCFCCVYNVLQLVKTNSHFLRVTLILQRIWPNHNWVSFWKCWWQVWLKPFIPINNLCS